MVELFDFIDLMLEIFFFDFLITGISLFYPLNRELMAYWNNAWLQIQYFKMEKEGKKNYAENDLRNYEQKEEYWIKMEINHNVKQIWNSFSFLITANCIWMHFVWHSFFIYCCDRRSLLSYPVSVLF